MRAGAGVYVPALATVTVTAAWAGLALSRPSSTFHFAPAIAGAAWPLTARLRRGRASLPAATRVAVGAFALTAGVAALLRALDALRGPAVVGGSALGESLIAAAVGAAWGAWALSRQRPGLVLSLLGITDDKGGETGPR